MVSHIPSRATAEPVEVLARVAIDAGAPRDPARAQGVSCVMPTRGRYAQPLLAVRMFQAQTYPNRELIVVDDNADLALAEAVDALDDPRIRVVRPATRGLTLGGLRNLAIAEARHSLICVWDDDDLYDASRIEAQVQALNGLGSAVCLLSRICVWWPLENRFAISNARRWECTLLCDWRQMARYPELDAGEDLPVVEELCSREAAAMLDLPGLYVYVAHGANTWSAAHFDRIWRQADQRFEGDACAAVLDSLKGRLPLETYRQALPRMAFKGLRAPVNFTLATGRPNAAGPPVARGPGFLFLQVNKRCNLRCQHCDFWRLDDADSANYLSRERRVGLIGEFARLNPDGAVVICGGESMLDLEEYFAIADACRGAGVRCLSVINGTRVRDARMAERMIREGPHEISVSLNGHLPEIHDRTRGVAGAFDKAVRALRLLVAARRRLRAAGTRIYVMGLIFDENFRDLPDFYDFVLNDVGADKLKLNFLQPSFGHADEQDSFYAEHVHVDPDALDDVLGQCDARFRLNYNPVWRRQVGMYFRSLQDVGDLRRGWSADTGTAEHICNTYDRNVMVDHYGVARLCFSHAFPGAKLEGPGDFERFWRAAEPIRQAMRSCNRLCGVSHSVRREHSTLRRTRAAVDHWGAPAEVEVQAFARSEEQFAQA